MANAIGIVAFTGFGKSTSYGHIPEIGIQGLNPAQTFVINVTTKGLPFRGWKRHYFPIPDPRVTPPAQGNYFCLADVPIDARPQALKDVLGYVNMYRGDIKHVVLDDYQYIMGEEFMEYANKAGYEKFSKLAKNAYDILKTGINMRHDIDFIVLTHPEVLPSGAMKMKTIGKMLDEKITIDGLFTVVLYGKQFMDPVSRQVSKQFVTNFDGEFPAKSPVGMFETVYVPNDLNIVLKKIHDYYEGA